MTNHLTTRVLEGPSPRLVVDQAELRVVAGSDRGTKVALGADSLLIGSSPHCDLVLHDGTVSARHAEVQLTTRGYFVRDLQSTNGIVCGAISIDRAPIADGMKLALGESVLAVKALGTQASVPLAQPGHVGSLITRSIKMRAFVAALERAADSDATVLVEGETGTGKELAAHTLHALSRRRRAPFVVFDCAGIAPHLAASELFGHEKGAFTDASAARAGLLEQAEGGTLFLDEIGDLPLELQPLLLGAIERRRSRRLGGQGDIRHDVRVVAATHRNLGEEVRAGRFRPDLYYRFEVVRLRVPPLRERLDDLPVLADQFASEIGASFSPEALAPLLAYDWPGNVRELRNTVTRMAIRGQPELEGGAPAHAPSARSREIFDEAGGIRPWLEVRRLEGAALEKEYFQLLLDRTSGHQARAADLAQITPQSLSLIVRKHALRRRPPG